MSLSITVFSSRFFHSHYDNRIKRRNAKQANNYARVAQKAVKMSTQQPNRFADEQKKRRLEDAQRLAKLDLSQKHDRQMSRLDTELEQYYGIKTIHAEIKAIDQRLNATGLRAMARNVLGRTERDRIAKENLQKTLKDAHNRMNYERAKLRERQEQEVKKLTAKTEPKIQEIQEQQEAQGRGGRGNTTRRRTNQDMLERYERRDINKPLSLIEKKWTERTAKPVPPDTRRKIDTARSSKMARIKQQFEETRVEIAKGNTVYTKRDFDRESVKGKVHHMTRDFKEVSPKEPPVKIQRDFKSTATDPTKDKKEVQAGRRTLQPPKPKHAQHVAENWAEKPAPSPKPTESKNPKPSLDEARTSKPEKTKALQEEAVREQQVDQIFDQSLGYGYTPD